MTITHEQFFAALQELKDARKQLKKCKPKELRKIFEVERQGDQAWEVIHTYGREEWIRRYGSTRPNPFGAIKKKAR